MSLVMPPDMEMWATTYLREKLTDVTGLQIDNKVPSDYRGESPLVTIRDDSGSQTEIVTYERSLGVTIYMGALQDVEGARNLARRVYALLTDPMIALEENPITAVDYDGCNGPYQITDSQHAASQYLTVAYSVVGEIL
jgi:hypothetical protein